MEDLFGVSMWVGLHIEGKQSYPAGQIRYISIRHIGGDILAPSAQRVMGSIPIYPLSSRQGREATETTAKLEAID